VTLRVKLDGETVTDVSYEGQGCSISQASTSVLTDLVVGRSVGEAFKTLDAFTELMQGRGKVEPDEEVLEDAVAFAGVSKYPARVKCACWAGWLSRTRSRVRRRREDDDVSDQLVTWRSSRRARDTGGATNSIRACRRSRAAELTHQLAVFQLMRALERAAARRCSMCTRPKW